MRNGPDGLGVLLGQDVALERVSSLDLTGFRQIEALLCAAVYLLCEFVEIYPCILSSVSLFFSYNT